MNADNPLQLPAGRRFCICRFSRRPLRPSDAFMNYAEDASSWTRITWIVPCDAKSRQRVIEGKTRGREFSRGEKSGRARAGFCSRDREKEREREKERGETHRPLGNCAAARSRVPRCLLYCNGRTGAIPARKKAKPKSTRALARGYRAFYNFAG